MATPESIDQPQQADGQPLTALEAVHRISTYDNHILSTFQECPRKFELGILKGLVPKRQARALSFGAAMHEGLATWYRYGAVAGKPTPTREDIEAVCVQLIDSHFSSPAVATEREAYLKALAKLTLHETRTELMVLVATSFLPPLADWQATDWRTSEALSAMLRGYAKQYEYEAFSVLHIERDFAFAIPHTPYLYSGRMDLVVDFNNEVQPLDHKSTGALKNYGDKYKLNQQFSGYITACNEMFDRASDNGIVNALLVPRRKELIITPDDFRRWTNIERKADRREEFLLNVAATIRDIEHDAERGYFPKDGEGSGACNSYGGCPMRQICECAPGPERDQVIAGFYDVRPWEPLANEAASDD